MKDRGAPAAGSKRIRRVSLAAVAAASLLLAMPGLGGVAAGQASIKEEREQLRETKERIRARAKKLRIVQRELNTLATQIALNEAKIHDAETRMGELNRVVMRLSARSLRLQARLDARNREAYILGPGVPVLYLLTATSAADAVARMSLLSEMNRRDGLLARRVQETQEKLSRSRAELVRLQRARELALQQLAIDRAEMRERMAESRRLYAALQDRQDQILLEISRVRPFAACPVDGPHAIADNFGIWVHHTKEDGGDHVHQGNDISAPSGTPIVAPFDGVAVTATNKIGGLAVKVFGDYGYVYNAHLSRYGNLGPVETGDVIGYVGATGNAGGPHDHFEWHPGGGAAVDPYGFLLLVC